MGFDDPVEKKLDHPAGKPIVVKFLAHLFDLFELRIRYRGGIHAISDIEAYRKLTAFSKLVKQIDLADITFSGIDPAHYMDPGDPEFVGVF